MEKIIMKFLENLLKNKKKRFEVNDLENFLIKTLKGHEKYFDLGGYKIFFETIDKLKNEGIIRDISSSDYNGMNPPLKNKWVIVSELSENRWSESKILKYSDLLNFDYYIKNPKYQSDREWEYIENIYKFLREKNSRDLVSVEERSLELFYDEKFLTSGRNKKENGKNGNNGVLSRFGLSYEDLKMKKYGEMFVYWNRGTDEVKKILIVENHSTFFTYKRVAKNYGNVFDFFPDVIIYGEGKKIESSFGFIDEILDTKNMDNMEILYFGDVDSEGISIYFRLKERYDKFNIGLHKAAYRYLILNCNRPYYTGEQRKNNEHLKKFIDEFRFFLKKNEIDFLIKILEKNLRIPQELLTYESFGNFKGEGNYDY